MNELHSHITDNLSASVACDHFRHFHRQRHILSDAFHRQDAMLSFSAVSLRLSFSCSCRQRHILSFSYLCRPRHILFDAFHRQGSMLSFSVVSLSCRQRHILSFSCPCHQHHILSFSVSCHPSSSECYPSFSEI
jgi:hypothetical protein